MAELNKELITHHYPDAARTPEISGRNPLHVGGDDLPPAISEIGYELKDSPKTAPGSDDDGFDRPTALSVTGLASNHPVNSPALTTFLLLNAMIGSGILNQPYVFYQSGILGGFIGFAAASLATWTGLLLMTEAGIKAGVLEYSGLARYAYQEHGERTIDVAIIVFTFGSQLGYILVVGLTVSSLLNSWGCDSVVCGNYFTTVICVALFVTPICLFRHFGHLAWLSIFSISAILIVLFLVIIAGPIKHKDDHDSADYVIFDIQGFMSSLGSIVFALSCASANFQAFISTEKSAQNMEGWSTITRNAVFIGTGLCSTMGFVGYLCFSNNTQGMILDNFPQPGYDFFKIMVVTHLICYIPVNFVIMRYSIVKITTGLRSELLESKTHTLLTIGLLSIVTLIVLGIYAAGFASGEGFALILNVTGGIGGK